MHAGRSTLETVIMALTLLATPLQLIPQPQTPTEVTTTAATDITAGAAIASPLAPAAGWLDILSRSARTCCQELWKLCVRILIARRSPDQAGEVAHRARPAATFRAARGRLSSEA